MPASRLCMNFGNLKYIPIGVPAANGLEVNRRVPPLIFVIHMGSCTVMV